MSPQSFFDLYKQYAIDSQGSTGVPASITLAQAALESGFGESNLAKNANNFFGIKTPGFPLWFGDYILANDDKPNEKFRKYDTVLDSFVDHANFLRQNSRYKSLFTNTNYVDWANGLQKAGYATNQQYASSLIGEIQGYNLAQYDKVGDVEMKKPINVIKRNKTTVFIVGLLIIIALFFIGKKVFKVK